MKPNPTARASARTIEETIHKNISDGVWKVNMRLPTERELSERFGAARNTVRKALESLEKSGTVVRQVGQGTFVARSASENHRLSSGPRTDLTDMSPAEVLEARAMIEPASAKILVARASPTDVQDLERCYNGCVEAGSLEEFEHWDAQFHKALIQLTKNSFLMAMYENVTRARLDSEWGQLKKQSATPRRRDAYNREHAEILQAVRDRDAERLEKAIRGHLIHVRRNLFGE